MLEKASGFEEALLLPPRTAVATFFSRASLTAPRIESVALAAAAGRILAQAAVAREDQPTHARSMMDGFAIAAAARGTTLTVAGAITMGNAPSHELAIGEALRIPTGGALPQGANAVVPQEDVTIAGERIELHADVRAGDFVTQPAEDVRAGEMVLAAGRRLGGPELGVLAALGYAEVAVFVRPRIAVVSTGDELIDVAERLAPGKVRDSNRFALAGALAAMGADVVHVPRVRDTRDALREAFARTLATHDAIFTTGGSSVGALDLVPEIVAELGSPGPIVHGIRVKPGKPTMLAAVNGKAIIGLPGNPTSALTILEAVARPIVAALTGERGVVPAIAATALEPFVGRLGWTWFVPARVRVRSGTFLAAPLRLRSSQTSLLARANGYATIGPEPARVETGDTVWISRFSSGGAPIEIEDP